VWDNREQSRRNSPQPSAGTMSRDELSGNTYERRFGRERDDPVNTGLVDLAMAETLFSFFIDHCHPFLPIVNVALDDAFTTIRQSPPLISALIAIAARFYVRFTTRSISSYPALDPSIPPRLANLAETHLGQTLLRKQHALSDVQAILLLAAWGLQSGGRGPDAWIVTGHAARVAELVSGSWLHATPKCTMLLDLGADSRSPGCAGSALTVSSLSDSVDPNLPSSKQSTNKVSSNSDLTKPSRVQDRPNQHRSTATCTLRARSSSRRSGGTSSTGGRC
jgi:hypothetical protein